MHTRNNNNSMRWIKHNQLAALLAIGAIAAASANPRAQAITIASWSFESWTAVTPGQDQGPISSDGGVVGGTASGHHASASTVWSTPAGNGSPKSLSSNTWAVGDYYQFQTSTIGYSAIQVAWDQTGSATGPRDFVLQYSTDGSTFTPFGSMYAVLLNGGTPNPPWNLSTPSSAYHYSVDLSSVTALDNASVVYFRLVDNSSTAINGGAVATAGTDRVDNFRISTAQDLDYFAICSGPGPTHIQFGTSEAPAIPANFFGPNSLGFADLVTFTGQPFPGQGSTSVVTGHENLNVPQLPPPAQQTVPIEIVALSLVSCQPITVHYCCGLPDELWDVTVGLSSIPAPPGTMTVNKTHNNGGTWYCVLPVRPRLTFRRISDSTLRVLDTALAGLPPIQLQLPPSPPSSSGQWVNQLSGPLSSSLFVYPGSHFNPSVMEQAPGDPNSQVEVHTSMQSSATRLELCAAHIVIPTGACCVTGNCSVTTEGNCATLHGTYRGDGSACTSQLAGAGGPRGGGPCVGDVDGNGVVDVNDLLAVLLAWGVCANPANCPADIAPICGDGVVNVNDLLTVITHWGPCA